MLEEAGAEPVRELGATLRFTCGKLFLGPSQLAKKSKDVVFTSRHSPPVVLERGLLKTSQMNEFVLI